MGNILDVEAELEKQFAKFQPVHGNDEELAPGRTRLALYYDESGLYEEYAFPTQRELIAKAANDEVMVDLELAGTGKLERPVKEPKAA